MKKTLYIALIGIVSAIPAYSGTYVVEMNPHEVKNTEVTNPDTNESTKATTLPSTSPETKPTSSVGNAGNTKPIGTDKGKTDPLQR